MESSRAMDMKLLVTELKMLQEAEECNKRAPIPCPSIDRSAILANFNKQKQKNQQEIDVTEAVMLRTWITGKTHCCTKSLAELKPIHFGQMKVPFVHEGHFLACRVLTEGVAVFATEVVVEDPQKRVHFASFYNFNANLYDSKWLKQGIIVLIKEPRMEFLSDAKNPSIRVDSPSDVIFVHKSNGDMLKLAGALCWYEPETLSAEELKKAGNAEFTKGNFEDALGYYQRALALTDGENDDLAPVLHLNMAAALLELKRYSETREKAQMALEGGANKEKAFYRLGCAAYGIRKWSEAIGHFESMLIINSESTSVTEQLARTKARLVESLTGKYDLKKLLDEEKRGERFMDVADYRGPVKVANIPGKGKGLIMTADVPTGTLLLAQKAYAFATDELDIGCDVLFKIEAIQKLKREPQTANKLYGLQAGKGADRNMRMPLEGVIDTGRIRQICELNCNRPDDHKIPMSAEEENAQLENNGTGLWIMPSYINHSCICNTHMVYHGDVVMVRAMYDLKKGDEVTTNYQSFLKTYEERNAVYTQKWGFQCDCRLCVVERHESPELVQKRKHFVEQFKNEQRKSDLIELNPRVALSRLLPLVNGIRETYRNRQEWRTQMVLPLTLISLVYKNLNESEKALEACQEALDALGPQLMCNYIPVLFARMAECYVLGMGNQQITKNMALKAYQFAQHKFGPMDKKLFLYMYPEFEQLM